MNPLPYSHVILPWLADVTVLSTFWLGLLWLVSSCLPGLSAARRHLLLVAGLACLPVLMLGTLRTPTWSLPVTVRVMESSALPVEHRPQHVVATLPSNPPPMVIPAAEEPRWQKGLLLLWLAGILTGSLGIGLTAWRLRRLRKGGIQVADERLLACWRRACAEAGIPANNVILMEHSGGDVVPMTWGIFRPVIVLPAEAGQWSDERLMLVLRHELAHVGRRDVLVALGTGLMLLPLWFHPLAWLVWREAHDARETACDDAALARSGEKPQAFAARLLDAVTGCGSTGKANWRLMPMALGMAARSAAALRRRLTSLLDEDRARQPWSRWQSRAIWMALAGGAMAVSGLTACRKTTSALSDLQQVILSSKVLSVPVDSETGRILASALGIAEPSLQLRGILTEPQALQLLRQLDAVKEQVQLLSAPTVTTRSGQKAKVEIVREFHYPTDFDPPTYEKGKPITPTTPTAFETRKVGVMMDFTPEVLPGGVIDLELAPEITQFLGFVDYGSPIRGEITGPDGKTEEVVMSENKAQQPIFHTLSTHTSVRLKDGQFLVVGGLSEHNQNGLNPGKPQALKAAAFNEEKVNNLIYFIIQAQIKK